MPDALICVISLNPFKGYMTEMILFPLLQMGKLRLILEISYSGFISIHLQNLLSFPIFVAWKPLHGILKH